MAEEPKKHKCKAGAPLWMCTFADMMSLLLCFFVLLLSFSVLDQVKFKEVAGSLKDAFGIQRELLVFSPPGAPEMISRQFESIPFDVKKEIMEIIEAEFDAGFIEVEEDAESITLRIKDSVAFESGKADIHQSFKPLLEKLGKVAVEADADIIVSGHTDNVRVKEDAPFASNWALSAARAVKVVEYWADNHKIPAHRLAAVGYADGHPVATNDTAEGRAKNRRVEFKIKPHQAVPAFEGIKELIVPGESVD